MINFETSPEDRALIDRIVDRAKHEVSDTLSLDMDLTACHCNGNPLDLQKLLEAPDVEFWHDLSGIWKYLDRKTGKLTCSFVPRCSA